MQKDEIKSLKKIDENLIEIIESAKGNRIFGLTPQMIELHLRIIYNELDFLCGKYPSYNELISMDGLHHILDEELTPLKDIKHGNQWIYDRRDKLMIDILDKIDFYLLGIITKVEEAKKYK